MQDKKGEIVLLFKLDSLHVELFRKYEYYCGTPVDGNSGAGG